MPRSYEIFLILSILLPHFFAGLLFQAEFAGKVSINGKGGGKLRKRYVKGSEMKG